jgi:thiol peroxidase
MPTERPGAVTLGGHPLTLLGPAIQPGDRAPEFTALGSGFQPVTLASSAGRTRVYLSAGSLDTPVCDLEAREFSRRAAALEGVDVVLVSMDLPFAQARWCGATGVENVSMASDHRDASFGLAWGVLVKESRLLSRAVFVVNPRDEVTYVEYVLDIDDQPDYDAAITAARRAAGTRT